MINYYFVTLCLAVLSAKESCGSRFFCGNEVLKSLINCLLRTDINSRLEVHGLSIYKFNRRLECAKQAKCLPSPLQIWDKKIHLVWQFIECMEEIRSRKEYTLPIYLHEFEWQCRDQLANGLPDDLKDYYLPLVH